MDAIPEMKEGTEGLNEKERKATMGDVVVGGVETFCSRVTLLQQSPRSPSR